ncbi:MAG: prolipoprotein diacylglyceryl transferase [Woeseiaceae bacterium]|nr:prolipoprotein diacylglyceryl transferase [Woeseiaceae bacterium]
MLVFPEIDPVIFAIGPVKIRWYGLMYVIGFVIAWGLARVRARRPDTPVDAKQVDDLIFYAMLGVIVGGRVGYCLVYAWDQLIDDPLYLFRITEGGMSFHGGLVGVMLAMWLYGRSLGKTIWHMTDFVAPIVPPGLFFGRIGNFINGELWGKPTDVAWGVLYRGQVLHPSQLYEALLEGLVLFAILWWYSSKPRPYLAVSGAFLFFYGAFRFFVEFYRVPDAHLGYLALDWVTMGQILSAPMIIAGIVMLSIAYRSHPAKEAEA